ncbi:UNVERIFIED_CONTAM: hypothetical protein NCL1_41075 [Trichonephila clavipes]
MDCEGLLETNLEILNLGHEKQMTPQLAQRTLLIPYHTSVRTLNHDRFNAYIKHGGFKEALGIKPMPLEQWLRFHNFRPSAPSTSILQNANTKFPDTD